MYYIIEITVDNGSCVVTQPIQVEESREDADSAYYGILSLASKSQHDVHCAILLDNGGMPIAYKSYNHKETVNSEQQF